MFMKCDNDHDDPYMCVRDRPNAMGTWQSSVPAFTPQAACRSEQLQKVSLTFVGVQDNFNLKTLDQLSL